ncbi:MAG TPA: hypothetical protein PKL77_11045, partial [Candidatus Omnitrophota bacterium]|nr:hypothetical protein [Candidatus Omnitrophota bacterium]
EEDLAKAQTIFSKNDYFLRAVDEAIARVGYRDVQVTACLRKIRDTLVIRAGPFAYIWGSFRNETLFLDQSLLKDSNTYRELILTLIHEARVMAYPQSQDKQNEAFALGCLCHGRIYRILMYAGKIACIAFLIMLPLHLIVCLFFGYLAMVYCIMPFLIHHAEAISQRCCAVTDTGVERIDLDCEESVREQLQKFPFYRIGWYVGYQKKVYSNPHALFVAKIPKKSWEIQAEHFFFRPKVFFWVFRGVLKAVDLIRKGQFLELQGKIRNVVSPKRYLVAPEQATIALVTGSMGAYIAPTYFLRDVTVCLKILKWNIFASIPVLEVQEKCADLQDYMRDLILSDSIAAADQLIDAFIAVIESLWERGIYVLDPKLSNFGISLGTGTVLLLDFGYLQYTVDQVLVFPDDFLPDIAYITHYSPQVAVYFVRRMTDAFSFENFKAHWQKSVDSQDAQDPHRAKDPLNPPSEEEMKQDFARALEQPAVKDRYCTDAVNEAIRRLGDRDALVTAALEKIRDTIIVRAGPFIYLWGAFYQGSLFLDSALLHNPSTYTELLRTLIHEAGVIAYPEKSDQDNEAFA